MATETLAQAFAMTRGILDNVTPDDYDKPTPCVVERAGGGEPHR